LTEKRRGAWGVLVKPWLKKGCFACVGMVAVGLVFALGLGVVFLVQQRSESAVEEHLIQAVPSSPTRAPLKRPELPSDNPTTDSIPGTVVLSLSSAAVTVKAGPVGEPIRVVSSFDPDVYQLEQKYEEDEAGGWIYRLDFHETGLFHASVVNTWLGKRSPKVSVVLPRDLPFALEAKMRGGYLSFDFAGLALTTVSVELDRGVLGLTVSEPLRSPVERLSLKGRMGTMSLSALGNASPKELHVQHGIGAALVDLNGMWLRDANVDFRVTLGNGRLRLPHDVRIEGPDGRALRLVDPADEEVRRPTLRLSTHFDMGDIRVID
jgi:hypothetical protein